MKQKIIILVLTCFLLSGVFSQSLEQAIKQYRYERYHTAAELFQKIVSTNPAETQAWYWLIKTHLAVNDQAAVLTSFRTIPPDVHLQPLYKVIEGSISLFSGDSAKAQTEFKVALGTGRKKNPLIQMAIAEMNILFDKGNLYSAIDLLMEASKKEKKNPNLYEALGDAYRKLYNGSESFRNYQQALELTANDPVVNYKIGKIYQTQNNESVYMQYYTNAINADPEFGPVYYQLYYANYFKDVNKALTYLQNFIRYSEPDIKHEYLLTDLYFVSKKYTEAIQESNTIIAVEKEKTKPRIYKLLAYSYEALDDNKKAEAYLKEYFVKENDTNYAAKDFELMAKISEKNKQHTDAAIWYEKALQIEKDNVQKIQLIKRISMLYKVQKQYDKQAYWSAQLYALSPEKFSNVDLFNWGVANYNAQDYQMADSVFAIYVTKYPEQSFGYYWRARSNAAIDTAMTEGLAIPHYESLIEVGLKDSTNATTKKWLIQAYGYIAAYKVNTEKQYPEALACYDRILALDPGNDDAEKYKGILTKMIETTKPIEVPNNK